MGRSSRRKRPSLPAPLRRALVPVVGRLQAWRTRNLDDRQRWERGLGDEVAFWDQTLTIIGPESGYRETDRSWSDDPVYQRVMDELPPELVEVDVIDVGAGPLTAVPKVYPGRQIRIVAFDPLADAYNARLDELGIEPIVRTQPGDGERLLELVDEASFDVAHASNCLDHAYDPGAAITAMARVLRPGGLFVLRHAHNEAVNQHYLGLHQWNFDERGGDFVVWRPGTERNLSQELAPLGQGEVWFQGPERELIWLWRRAA